MTSHILQALPDIHGILIGVSIAFYSAFAIYVYQKLDANKEESNRLAAEARRLGTPDLILSDSHNFLRDNALDWTDKADPFFTEMREVCKEIENGSFPEHQYCTEIIFKLCETFYWMYVTYPFFGEYNNCQDTYRLDIEMKKNTDITPQRISELDERLKLVSWLKSHSYDQIVILAKIADELERKGVHMQGLSTENFDGNDVKMVTYEYLIKNYFYIADELEFKILPQLKHATLSREHFLKKLDIKTLSRNSRAIFLYTLTAGIILPLILIEANESLAINERTPYILLLLTITPYFFMVDVIYKKIKSLKL